MTYEVAEKEPCCVRDEKISSIQELIVPLNQKWSSKIFVKLTSRMNCLQKKSI